MERPRQKMICEIEWNNLPLAEWERLFAQCPRANLLQSYNYAQAASSVYGLKPKWGLIKIDGAQAGLVQIFEGGIFSNALHVVTLDCGPAWLPGHGTPKHISAFFQKFDELFPRRFGRRRRIIPDIPGTPENHKIMQDYGFKQLPRPGYETVWMDLRPNEDRLLAGLEGNWRNKLRKAQRAGLKIEWDFKGKNFLWLLQAHETDKYARGYKGPSARMLKSMAGHFANSSKMIVARVLRNDAPLAAAMILRHGSCATWQISWSNTEGKENAAPTLLLWESALMMKGQNVYDLDLGGVNETGAQSIKTFKEGTGGDLVCLAGHYI